MIRLLPAPACALAVLLATSLSAQDGPSRCPNGPSDADGIAVSVSAVAHPTQVAGLLDSLLVENGYVIKDAPASAGEWVIAPRFTWTDAEKETDMAREPHPGLLLSAYTEPRGDSVRVEVGARVLCRTKSAEEVHPLALLAASMLVAQITGTLDSLEAAGADLSRPVERRGFSVRFPDEVGGFRLAGREDFDDPRLGTSLRYRREDGMYFDVYVYPGPRADSTCPVACAEARVREETDGFVDSFGELINRGYYRRIDVRRNEALPVPDGAPWRAGRELVMEVVRGQGPTTPLLSRFILYSFPGYQVKVRVTHPPTDEMEGVVRAFVAALLTELVPT